MPAAHAAVLAWFAILLAQCCPHLLAWCVQAPQPRVQGSCRRQGATHQDCRRAQFCVESGAVVAMERIVMCSESSIVCVHHQSACIERGTKDCFHFVPATALFALITFVCRMRPSLGLAVHVSPALVRLKHSIATSTLHGHAQDIVGGVKMGR
jgi:hypothetical protein